MSLMARQTKRLSARAVETLSKPGRHADGDGLYLVIDSNGSKRWVFLFRWREPGTHGAGKLREMGLGGESSVSLADARERTAEARRLLAAGRNPIEERKAAARAKATARTFGAFAEPLVDEITAGFKNKKHKKQWLSTLKTYCTSMWKKPIEAIDTADVLGVLSPIWSTKSETASRLRGRIERVLDAARAMGLRSGENPARWRGHLSTLLPRRKKLTRGHHAALPYADMPAFMAELRRRTSASARGLEFLILTAARTEEVIGAKKGEVHRRNKLWTVPQSG